MKYSTLITLLKIEIDNFESMLKYYKDNVDIKFFQFYINEIEIKINSLMLKLGGNEYYGTSQK